MFIHTTYLLDSLNFFDTIIYLPVLMRLKAGINLILEDCLYILYFHERRACWCQDISYKQHISNHSSTIHKKWQAQLRLTNVGKLLYTWCKLETRTCPYNVHVILHLLPHVIKVITSWLSKGVVDIHDVSTNVTIIPAYKLSTHL